MRIGLSCFILVHAIVVPAKLVAETFVVDSSLDTMTTGCSPLVVGDCTLRGAIERSNLSGALDTITFGFSITTIQLNLAGSGEDLNQSGDLDILDSVTIVGNGNTTIDATLLGDRVFDFRPGDEASGLSGVRIIGGSEPPGAMGVYSGGGIACQNHGLLGLSHVTIDGNGPVDQGGGIYVNGCDVILNYTTVIGNTATNGGGIYLSSGTLSAPLSAVVDNHATNDGGGLAIGVVFPEASLDNMTFSGNTAGVSGSAILNSHLLSLEWVTIVSDPQSGVAAIAHVNSGATTTIANSLIVGSCEPNPGSTFVSAGGNLESPGDTCDLNPTLDQLAVADARLLPLGDYGGDTPSHMPMADSPAVDDPLGTTTNCPTYDQRFGAGRPLDGNGDGLALCDIGAIERDTLFVDGFESGGTTAWSSTGP